MLLGMITGVYSIGSTLLSVAVASSIFVSSGSVTRSALIFIVQYLPVAIAIKTIWRVSERNSPRTLIGRLCVAAGGISFLCGAAFGSTPLSVLYGLLALRGLVECSLKQSRSVLLKFTSTESRVGSDNATILFFEFSGQTIGAILAILILGKLSIFSICCADVALLFFSAVLSSRLPDYDTPKTNDNVKSLLGVGRIVWQSPILCFYFWLLVSLVIVLQSTNQILRTWLPLQWLGFNVNGSGFTETISLGGIVVGIIITRNIVGNSGFKPYLLMAVTSVSAILFMLIFTSRNQGISLGIYFLYMTTFEIGISYALGALIANVNQESIKGVMAVFYGISYGGLCVTGVALSLLTDAYGLNSISWLVALSMVMLAIIFYFRLHFWRANIIHRRFYARHNR